MGDRMRRAALCMKGVKAVLCKKGEGAHLEKVGEVLGVLGEVVQDAGGERLHLRRASRAVIQAQQRGQRRLADKHLVGQTHPDPDSTVSGALGGESNSPVAEWQSGRVAEWQSAT
eukprot:1188375-Prorocentrum_minimum.AAC.3